VLLALRRGIEVFHRWGVPLPRRSWIQEAQERLERASATASLGESDEDLRYISVAVAWAVDLYHISTCLGSEPSRRVAAELSRITRGSLVDRRDASVAKNYLSQFWVGALLAQSKLKPHILAYDVHGDSKPDFVVECEGVKFAVEVKRPSKPSAALRAVHAAGDQIRDYDRPGIIIVDVTDCTTIDPWEITRERRPVRERVGEELNQMHLRLSRLIDTYTRSNKFHQVTMLMTFARYWPWIVDSNPHRDAGLNFRATSFSYRWSHQIIPLTRLIQERLLVGVEQLTGNRPSHSFY